ncbi:MULTISPECIES: universal stress protein [unclassified Haladaptatus]|uniref:universal stress protein n=1 Tax=unclassified Haladaptatus TaxID=2622732 RepID=UPI0023E88488|nr:MULTISPECIES: universal stress protein [unclassified Haladaptatus]
MTILAAVDGDVTEDNVVTVGADMADAYDDDLTVINVLSQEDFDDRQADRADSDIEYFVDDGIADAAKVAAEVVEGTVEKPGRIDAKGRVGDVTEELLDEAARQDARYLVIGGRKRTPVGKALFGSTTQSILLSAELPVVVVMSDP